MLSYTCSNADGRRLPSHPRPLEHAQSQMTTSLTSCGWKWGKYYNSAHMLLRTALFLECPILFRGAKQVQGSEKIWYLVAVFILWQTKCPFPAIILL